MIYANLILVLGIQARVLLGLTMRCGRGADAAADAIPPCC